MFGQMTAGSWIYIGTPGHPPGHVPDVRGRRRAALRLGRPERAHDPDRRPRRDGRRAAARGDDGGRGDPLRRGRSRADRAPARDALPRRGHGVARRGARARAGGCRRGAAALGRAPRERGRGGARARRFAASRSTSSPTRPPHTIPSPATSLPGSRSRTQRRCGRRIRTSTSAAPASRSPGTSRDCSSTSGCGSYVFDYGNNLRGEAHEAGVTEAFTYPGFVPAYIRPLFCRGVGPFRWAALSGEPSRHRCDRRGAPVALPGGRAPAALARAGSASELPSRDSRPGSAGSASATAPARASRSTSSCARARWRHRS